MQTLPSRDWHAGERNSSNSVDVVHTALIFKACRQNVQLTAHFTDKGEIRHGTGVVQPPSISSKFYTVPVVGIFSSRWKTLRPVGVHSFITIYPPAHTHTTKEAGITILSCFIGTHITQLSTLVCSLSFFCPPLIGASLSEPHTSGTALRKCVCMYLCLRPYTVCAFKYFPKIGGMFLYQNWHILETKFYQTWFILVCQLW